MQNTSLEFHDSEVSSIDVESSNVTVKFSAAPIHRSNGRPGIDAVEGYIQAIELRILGCRVTIHEEGCVGRISDGSIDVDGAMLSTIPIPFEKSGDAKVSLTFANGSRFEGRGNGISLQATSEAKFVDSFKC